MPRPWDPTCIDRAPTYFALQSQRIGAIVGDPAETSSTSFARGVLAWIEPVIAFAMGAMLIAAASQWRNPGVVGRWPMPQALFAGGLFTTLGLVAALARRTPRAVALLAASLPIAAALFAGILSYRAV